MFGPAVSARLHRFMAERARHRRVPLLLRPLLSATRWRYTCTSKLEGAGKRRSHFHTLFLSRPVGIFCSGGTARGLLPQRCALARIKARWRVAVVCDNPHHSTFSPRSSGLHAARFVPGVAGSSTDNAVRYIIIRLFVGHWLIVFANKNIVYNLKAPVCSRFPRPSCQWHPARVSLPFAVPTV